MKELYNRLWNRIEELKMRPIPRWVFVLRRLGIWIALTASVVLGAFCLAYLVYAMQQADVLMVAGADPLAALSTLMPVWLLFFAVFVALALWGVEQTDRGYKVPFTLWMAGNIAVTGVGALLLLATGAPAGMDVLVERHIEPLSAAGMARPLWQRPGAGRIQGRVTRVEPEQFILEDPQGDSWRILLRKETRVGVPIEVERRLGVMGRLQEDHVIEAREVVPLRRPLQPRPGEGRPVPPPPRPAR